jgi:uncharacterized membrane-anchored protein
MAQTALEKTSAGQDSEGLDKAPSQKAELLAFAPHQHRGTILGEVHARPFRPVRAPARLLHFAFAIDGPQAGENDRNALIRFCEERGIAPPRAGAKQHVAKMADGTLAWEQHGEFCTYTWELQAVAGTPFQPAPSQLAHPMALLPQPGPHLCSVDLHLLPLLSASKADDHFDKASLCGAVVDDGGATLSTDFKPGAEGFVRFLLELNVTDPDRIGALAQQTLELETYRTLAMLGLPEAQRLSPRVRGIESALADITARMAQSKGLESNQVLLDELTDLAARLEADAAASLYRFGASAAYDGILASRLKAIGEESMTGRPTIDEFLSRRHGPAMRTCQAIVERQEHLSRKLARATQLLRSRVEIEIEQQNRDLLGTMNERTDLQLRLQQTVEGLSVVAISYYLVGLLSYFTKAAYNMGWIKNAEMATAIGVPFVILLVWSMIRRLRKKHFSKSGR